MLQRFALIQFQKLSGLCISLICFLTAEMALGATCRSAKAQFLNRFETLQLHAEKNFGEKIVNSENFPLWIDGKNKNKNQIVYLIHGFIGTPFEMRSTAKAFVDAGFTVVLDVLPGHGLSGDAANTFSSKDIQNHVFSNIEAIKTCNRPLHLIGFSTGATLLHNYLQSHESDSISSLVLISPYYSPSVAFGDLLAHGATFFLSTLSVRFAYTVSRFPDIEVAYLDPAHYFHDIPLYLANEINSLGKNTLFTLKKIETPTLVFSSAQDKIASPLVTPTKIFGDFTRADIRHFPPFYLAPHHLMSETVSPVAEYVHQTIFSFVKDITE